MKRVYNFSAGPSMLPESVLQKAADEMLSYNGSGQSVMEMSHRSKVYDDIIVDTEKLLREIMGIPDNYKVLFMQGGASSQFAMVPMNLMTKNRKADYIISGEFSTKAYKEACKYGDCKIVASSKDDNFTHTPAIDESQFRIDADYLHYCMNNTIFGTAFSEIPKATVPLVSDISSCILSRPIDVSKFGILYAGAQKNAAPAGLTIVIIRNDLLTDSPLSGTPSMFTYKTIADSSSMYNTPPCYSIYVCKLVLEWIKNEIGGLKAMEKRNITKAEVLYNFLDQSKLFKACADKKSRSIMNVTFVTGSDELDAKFVKESAAAGFVNLKGHRSVGGMRASIYNAMPPEGIDELVEFMTKFEEENI